MLHSKVNILSLKKKVNFDFSNNLLYFNNINYNLILFKYLRIFNVNKMLKFCYILAKFSWLFTLIRVISGLVVSLIGGPLVPIPLFT